MIDPYAPCLCGSGKRVKWCCQKAIAPLSKILELLEAKEPQKALDMLEKSKPEFGEPGYHACLRAHILMGMGNLGEAEDLLDKTVKEYPKYGFSHDLLADLFMSTMQTAAAVSRARTALSLYPPEAVEHRVNCLIKIGDCQIVMGKPVAAWAAWQQAAKLSPEHAGVQERLDHFKSDPVLPNFVKHGTLLRSPDELNVFNADRRSRWDECLSKDMEWQLEDLAETFEYLAKDDPSDTAAWFNLGLVAAWLGENVKAVEAFDHFVAQENDFESAANAWDLCELLRSGDGCDAIANDFDHTVIFRLVRPEEFSAMFGKCRRMVVVPREGEKPDIYWLNQPMTELGPDSKLIVKPTRRIARVAGGNGHLAFYCATAEDADDVIAAVNAEFGSTIEFTERNAYPARLGSIDNEPGTYLPSDLKDAATVEKFLNERTRIYFEEVWINRPLKSLSGLSPINANQRPLDRKKLEGVIRFRERLFLIRPGDYDFGRLRNKLGLESKRRADDDPKIRDISALSVQELVKLVPSELTDDELLLAYRAANSLDAPRTALQFGEEIVGRDSLAGKIDGSAVYRRIVNDKLEHNYKSGLAELIEKAIAYDKRHYGGDNLAELRVLQARARLLEGNTEAACDLFKELADKDPSNLGLLAGVVEKLLSAGIYKKAHEFAQLGYDRALASRQKDFQEQFRDYLSASARRL